MTIGESDFSKDPVVTIDQALEVCSLFASRVPNQGTEYVCVRPSQVEGTNGHVLMLLKVEALSWIKHYRLVPAAQATIVGLTRDAEQLAASMDYRDGVGEFPNTQKFIKDTAEIAPVFSCRVSPFYLELIGKAFGMLGTPSVQLVCRGEFAPLEFIGQTPVGSVGRAFLMPKKSLMPKKR